MTTPREIIVTLNSLGVGDIEAIRSKLAAAGESVEAMGEPDLAVRLGEAAVALVGGNLPEYRRLLSLVVSRLGHIRP